jgi:hypothetical protein
VVALRESNELGAEQMNPPSQNAPGRPAERRKFGRRDTFKPAMIVLKSGESLPCVVVNESVEGAALKIDALVCPDEQFDLVIPDDDIRVACRVANRTSDRIGVQYISLPCRASRSAGSARESAQNLVRAAFKER